MSEQITQLRSPSIKNNAQKIYQLKAANNNTRPLTPHYVKMISRLLGKIEYGQITLTDHHGRSYHFKGKDRFDLIADLKINHFKAVQLMMTKGQLGLCEGYIKNHWQSDNLTNIFTFFLLNKSAVQRYYHANKYFTTFARIQHHILKRNSKKGSRNNIMAHYDLGNDFYQSWLDHSMTYSSALFKSPDDSLETAQYQKMDALIAALDIQPHHHILEIGCGWGGLSAYIAEKTGCKIHAITISPSQHAYAKSMIHEKGLSDQVHVEIRDYRDIVGEYDRIVSVEMIEAVGQDYWQTYFNTLSNHLKNNGKAVLQAITIRDDLFPQYQKTVDFIQAYIFPGGMLPTPKIIEQHAKNAGLSQINSVSFGMDYAHTLRHWYDRFQSAWIKNDREIATKFDAEFKNIWDLYLCYCEAGFKEGNLDVIHVTLQK